MSLYGHSLAQYVVEFSLGIPTSCDGRTAGMFGEVAMAKPWDGVGTTAMLGRIRHKSRLLGGCDAHTGGETSVGMLQAR
jgi:hypothetical protein